jgi:aspartate aminotransferase
MNIEMCLSNRTKRIKPSPTMLLSAKAAQLKSEGKSIVNLTAGEPDFDTPDFIKQKAIEAINSGFTKYTPVGGTPALKAAIVEKFKIDNRLNYTNKQVLVSCGAKQSLFNATQALLNPEDEVIIPAPYWVSYPDMVLLTGAIPVVVETDIQQNFKMTAEQLEKAISSKTKLLFLNSPSNPSGMVYSLEELKALTAVLLKHPQVWIVTDDIYEHILWKKPFFNILNACPELYERTIVVNGPSKAYAMTGWRIGYAAGHEKIIAVMSKIQSQSTSNPNSIAQVATQAALLGNQDCVMEMCQAYETRSHFVSQALNEISGVSCLKTEGTFYNLPNVKEWMKTLKLKDDVELSEHLLYEAGVAVVPGSAFGLPGYIRLSCATDLKVLEEGLSRMKAL